MHGQYVCRKGRPYGQPENRVRESVLRCTTTWTGEVLNVSKVPIVMSDNKRTLHSSDCLFKRLYPCALKLWRQNHLGRRSLTSATITLQRWFKPASLSFKKPPSVWERFWTIPSPVLLSAAKLGWWLLSPSSSSCNRGQPEIKSPAKARCSDAVDPPGMGRPFQR